MHLVGFICEIIQGCTVNKTQKKLSGLQQICDSSATFIKYFWNLCFLQIYQVPSPVGTDQKFLSFPRYSGFETSCGASRNMEKMRTLARLRLALYFSHQKYQTKKQTNKWPFGVRPTTSKGKILTYTSLPYSTFELLNPCPQHIAKGPHCVCVCVCVCVCIYIYIYIYNVYYRISTHLINVVYITPQILNNFKLH